MEFSVWQILGYIVLVIGLTGMFLFVLNAMYKLWKDKNTH